MTKEHYEEEDSVLAYIGPSLGYLWATHFCMYFWKSILFGEDVAYGVPSVLPPLGLCSLMESIVA